MTELELREEAALEREAEIKHNRWRPRRRPLYPLDPVETHFFAERRLPARKHGGLPKNEPARSEPA
jgi:hypothetical protein